MNTDNTMALVIAAGLSRRFGSDKRLAMLNNGNTLISQTVAAIKAANVDYRIAIQPNDVETFSRLFPKDKLIAIDDYEKGMGHTIAGALNVIKDECSCCLICLADMPFVLSDTYRAIANAIDSFDAVVPCYEGLRGNPVAISRSLFPRFLSLEGDIGGKYILNDNFLKLLELEVDDPGILKDIDAPSDL